jgi:hypothetical protein
MLLELLMVLFIRLAAEVGEPAAIVILGLLIVAVLVLVWLLYRVLWVFSAWVFESVLGMRTRDPSAPLALDHFGKRIDPLALARRRTHGGPAGKLEKMNDAALRRWVAKRPRDKVASLLLCERLRNQGDLQAYADERERYLSVDQDLDVSEKSTYYHQLADLYVGPLRRPDKAREILREFLQKYPRSGEALLTRERLRRLEATKAAPAAAPPATGSGADSEAPLAMPSSASARGPAARK